MKKILFMFTIIIGLMFAFGCEEKPVKGNLDTVPGELTLEVGDVYTLDIEEGIILDTDSYDIVNPDMDLKTITALKAGTAIVTVSLLSDLSVTKDITITVTEEEVVISEEAIYEWLCSIYADMEVDKDVEFIKKYKNTDIQIDYEPLHNTYLRANGKYVAPLLDTHSKLTFYYEFPVENADGTTTVQYCEKEVNILLKGYGNEAIGAIEALEKNLPDEIDADYNLPITDELYSAEIKWYYNDKLLENGVFVVAEDLADSFTATIKAVATAKGNTAEGEFKIFVSHLTTQEKLEAIKEDLINRYSSLSVEGNIEMIREEETFGGKINWYAWAPHKLTAKGEYTKPLKDSLVYMQATVTLNQQFIMFDVPFNLKGENKVGTWEKIEAFLSRIALPQVQNQQFILYGWESEADGFDGDYRYVPSYNFGYLPFYTTENVKITEDIIPISHAGRPGTTRKSTNYITIHNTGMAHPQSTAEYLNKYIHTDTTKEASWHFSVDDKEAYQHLPLTEVGWHAGDGSTQYGGYHYNDTYKKWCINGGNQNSVGLETCVYKGVDYNMTMRNTAKIVARLLIQFGLSTTQIRQHYDFAGKDCPQVLRHSGRWPEQLQLIELEYYALTELNGVTFEWTSLTPGILDNNGKVSSTRPEEETTVSYKVSVGANGETKEFTFESVLKALTFTPEEDGDK